MTLRFASTRMRQPRVQHPIVPFQFRLFPISEMQACLGMVPLNELFHEETTLHSAYRGSGDVICLDCGCIVYDHPAFEWLDEYGQVIGSVRVICCGERVHT